MKAELLLTGHLQEVLLDGENLFFHFINLYATSTVVGWGLVLGGSVPPLFSRLTDAYTDRLVFQQTGPFHITGVFKGAFKTFILRSHSCLFLFALSVSSYTLSSSTPPIHFHFTLTIDFFPCSFLIKATSGIRNITS